MSSARAHGATSVSFWSWQHANEPAWGAITNAPDFRIGADAKVIAIPFESPSA